MCGIAGYLTYKRFADSEKILKSMGLAIESRGPDSSGEWSDPDAGIGLSHRRLSIVDLSPAGHQPMASMSGRYIISFNGEIYNHLKLRYELGREGKCSTWHGRSDTETLLAAFDVWGIEESLKRAIGMFAIAVWDKQSRILTLVRDRLGEKPLYYGWSGSGENKVFLFGSELRALKAHPGFDASINREAIFSMMEYNCIPAPASIYHGIYKLQPGSILRVSLDGRGAQPLKYWDPKEIILNGLNSPYEGSPDESVKDLENLLRDSVAQQKVADVPLGAFLSGGVDSSTVVALMQALSGSPIKTFTIGFTEIGYDEAKYAASVARYLGTDHTELYLTPKEAMDVIPKLPTLYSEPFSDSSQIPTYLVSQMARKHVTVSISGDAGDELFGGYQRYLFGKRIRNIFKLMPAPIRTSIANIITSVSPQDWNRFLSIIRRHDTQVNIGDKLHKGATLLAAKSYSDLYKLLVTHWPRSSSLVIGVSSQDAPSLDTAEIIGIDSFIHHMMATDLVTYLPNDILCKVDRAAMGVSLETRIPFLDHRVVEYAWKLPLSYKIRNGVGKWPLRQILYKYVPQHLIDRPKMGFGVPIDSWLRGPLRDWAETLISESRLRQEGHFNPAPIRLKWEEHLSGKRNWQYHLWDVLMFQAWLEHNA